MQVKGRGCAGIFHEQIVEDYFLNTAQITYYRMRFGGYGYNIMDYTINTDRYPKDWKNAEIEAANLTHCFNPWWEDGAYCANYNSSKMWCNQCAYYLESIRDFVT